MELHYWISSCNAHIRKQAVKVIPGVEVCREKKWLTEDVAADVKLVKGRIR